MFAKTSSTKHKEYSFNYDSITQDNPTLWCFDYNVLYAEESKKRMRVHALPFSPTKGNDQVKTSMKLGSQ